MRSFIVGVFGWIIAMGLSILVMIHGWGLEPISWWWIIGGGFLLKTIIEVITYVGKEE